MTDIAISPTPTTVASTSATSATSTDQAASPAITSDFDTFLKMLTVQMQNQDPLNPIQSEDFAVQLATFSGVEQQVRTNDLLAAMQTGLGGAGVAGYADWIGREARVEGTVQLNGTPVTLEADPPAATSRSVLVAQLDGRDVARIELGRIDGPFEWSGTDATGGALLPGEYQISVEHYAGDALLNTAPVASYLRIAEARSGTNGVTLVTDSGLSLAPSTITGLRAER
ncbi:flagellar hook capping FlgD N-terminal domain-containing protein [Anianabacter salinae]|uniref:flagellar hook capping FlgD N-terminal domain-containing protein n=1 Tax=Anianabacter salinae TaxID=2851023 RepID=UPI00225DF652|nr:flagellar hook capping FlgD N-terminal domain-containing protein [Anianabacter salinae]MBV0913438.1 flagellar hook assembly protein FlgD [Anianabacter salinae]